MRKYIHEVLQELDTDLDLLNSYKEDNIIKELFKYGFDPDYKFILPDGIPEYKQNLSPMGIAPIELINNIRKFYIFCRMDLTPFKRETLFLEMVEGLTKVEAEIFIAIKDQNLKSLYPRLSHSNVEKYGFKVK